MYPLSGQIFKPADDDRATTHLFVSMHTGEDAQLFSLAVGNSNKSLPDLLCHKLIETLKSGMYPGDLEDYQEGRLMIITPLTYEQAQQQWQAMGLRPESTDYEVAGAMEAYVATQQASASKAELASTTTANDAQITSLTDQVAALTKLVTQLTQQPAPVTPTTLPAPNPPPATPEPKETRQIHMESVEVRSQTAPPVSVPPSEAPSPTKRKSLAGL